MIKNNQYLKWWEYTNKELAKYKNDQKSTISYMVKEFEMKKSADLYKRASVSKTGTLNMGALHTYQFNEDLFAKVTTLPGAKNHGLVLFLDWSGSMAHNLVGTMNQLFNIIWFCNRTQIPFEVYGFSNVFNRRMGQKSGDAQKFKSGDLVLNVSLLNFFSSRMKTQDQNDMMHYLYMLANRWTYRSWNTEGYPYQEPAILSLGSTPLNDAIVCLNYLFYFFLKQLSLRRCKAVGHSN